MAHGFRYVPEERKVQPADDRPRCPFCHALLNGRAGPLDFGAMAAGVSPHLCKETAPGTPLAAPPVIPFTQPPA